MPEVKNSNWQHKLTPEEVERVMSANNYLSKAELTSLRERLERVCLSDHDIETMVKTSKALAP